MKLLAIILLVHVSISNGFTLPPEKSVSKALTLQPETEQSIPVLTLSPTQSVSGLPLQTEKSASGVTLDARGNVEINDTRIDAHGVNLIIRRAQDIVEQGRKAHDNIDSEVLRRLSHPEDINLILSRAHDGFQPFVNGIEEEVNGVNMNKVVKARSINERARNLQKRHILQKVQEESIKTESSQDGTSTVDYSPRIVAGGLKKGYIGNAKILANDIDVSESNITRKNARRHRKKPKLDNFRKSNEVSEITENSSDATLAMASTVLINHENPKHETEIPEVKSSNESVIHNEYVKSNGSVKLKDANETTIVQTSEATLAVTDSSSDKPKLHEITLIAKQDTKQSSNSTNVDY